MSRIGSLLEIEPPDHTRVKDVFHQTFTPKRVRELSAKVTALCEGLVDDLEARPERHADLIEDFAQPIPVTVIADLLGIPEADRHRLVPWSSGIIGWFEPERTPAMEGRGRPLRATSSWLTCKTSFLSAAPTPGDDLFSAMLKVHDAEPERLSELRTRQQLHLAPQRRARGGRERHRQRAVRAALSPKPVGRGQSRPRAHPHDRRRDDALRHAAAILRTRGARAPSTTKTSAGPAARNSASTTAAPTATRRCFTTPTPST